MPPEAGSLHSLINERLSNSEHPNWVELIYLKSVARMHHNFIAWCALKPDITATRRRMAWALEIVLSLDDAIQASIAALGLKAKRKWAAIHQWSPALWRAGFCARYDSRADLIGISASHKSIAVEFPERA
jgi:hypothetical protein